MIDIRCLTNRIAVIWLVGKTIKRYLVVPELSSNTVQDHCRSRLAKGEIHEYCLRYKFVVISLNSTLCVRTPNTAYSQTGLVYK